MGLTVHYLCENRPNWLNWQISLGAKYYFNIRDMQQIFLDIFQMEPGAEEEEVVVMAEEEIGMEMVEKVDVMMEEEDGVEEGDMMGEEGLVISYIPEI